MADRLDFKELHVLAREVCVCEYVCVCVCVFRLALLVSF